MRKNSIKNTRINGEVQKELSRIISRQIKDPRIHPMTSVVGVQVTPDLKYCKVHISVLGSPKERQDTMEGLQSAEGYIRRELARTVNLRITPELIFVEDESIAYGVGMAKKIDEVISADEAAQACREEESSEEAAARAEADTAREAGGEEAAAWTEADTARETGCEEAAARTEADTAQETGGGEAAARAEADVAQEAVGGEAAAWADADAAEEAVGEESAARTKEVTAQETGGEEAAARMEADAVDAG